MLVVDFSRSLFFDKFPRIYKHMYLSGTMSASSERCPFCSQTFKSLGHHLPRCKARNGQGYKHLLRSSSGSQPCPSCKKVFKRLDLHLRASYSCGMSSSQERVDKSVPDNVLQPQTHSESSAAAKHKRKLSSPSRVSTNVLNPLQLPDIKDSGSWAEVNTTIRENLGIDYLLFEDPDELHDTLVSRMYSVLLEKLGDRPLARHHRHRRHDRQLRKFRDLKNEARRAFRTAKRNNEPASVITALSRSFHILIKQHSRARKASLKAHQMKDAQSATAAIKRDFWRYTNQLLRESSESVKPHFTSIKAFDYFQGVYTSKQEADFHQPKWLPNVTLQGDPPDHPAEPVSIDEVRGCIRRSRAKSAPSPIDQISYLILKMCPSLHPLLVHLYNLVLQTRVIPQGWRQAVFKLIPKAQATDDPSNPKNFRPIALTSCIGKIFSLLIKHRLDEHMIGNGLLDTSVQKAFQTKIPGCEEHQFKLHSVLQDANSNARSLTIAWIDLENAYGSVPHKLIAFALNHYQVNPYLVELVCNLYTNLTASVLTPSWATASFAMEVGVFQGDPLSVSIFNVVINTLVDPLVQHCFNLGYRFSSSNMCLNLLQYADDTCLLARDPRSCQRMLNVMEEWLTWSGMRAKPSKCQAVALKSRTNADNRVYDPQLVLGSSLIPFLGNTTTNFLGMPLSPTLNTTHCREIISTKVQGMMQKIDCAPLSSKYKLLIYRRALPAKVGWILKITHTSPSFVSRTLESCCTRLLKKWLRMPRCANPNSLYLSATSGGLALPSISAMYTSLQATKLAALSKSCDPIVCELASRHIAKNQHHRPAKTVHTVMCHHPMSSKSQAKAVVKRMVDEFENAARCESMSNLEVQGRFRRQGCTGSTTLDYWSKAVWALPSNIMSFALNAAQDTLPHNSNLVRWKRNVSPQCRLCGQLQTLRHVLNACPVALKERRYDARHNAVLAELARFISCYLSHCDWGKNYNITVDLPTEEYRPPHHLCPTNLKPDLVIWNDAKRAVFLIELTCPFEENFVDAAIRKDTRYHDLANTVRSDGVQCTVWPVQVRSRGMVDRDSFMNLLLFLGSSGSAIASLFCDLSSIALRESHSIWCSRNCPSDS